MFVAFLVSSCFKCGDICENGCFEDTNNLVYWSDLYPSLKIVAVFFFSPELNKMQCIKVQCKTKSQKEM